MKISHGFTLIEVMITVAIVAILSAIAYPSYLDHIKKGRRTEGREAVLNQAALQERVRIQTNSYSAVAPPIESENGWYTVSVDNTEPCDTEGQCFVARAVAAGVQAEDTDCLVFAVDNLGRRFAYNAVGDDGVLSADDDTSAACW